MISKIQTSTTNNNYNPSFKAKIKFERGKKKDLIDGLAKQGFVKNAQSVFTKFINGLQEAFNKSSAGKGKVYTFTEVTENNVTIVTPKGEKRKIGLLRFLNEKNYPEIMDEIQFGKETTKK